MYYYKITTKENVQLHGISSDIQQLQYLLNQKTKHSNVEGKIEIFENRKVLASYYHTSAITKE